MSSFFNYRRAIAFTLLTSLLPVVSSCSFLANGKQAVSITASESDAEIFADGQYLGKGSVTAYLAKGESHAISAQKGNRYIGTSIDYSLAPVGFVDAVGGCLLLLPAAGLASDGAWKLDKTSVYLKFQ